MKHGRQFVESIIPEEEAGLFDEPCNHTPHMYAHMNTGLKITPVLHDSERWSSVGFGFFVFLRGNNQFVLVGLAESFTLG